MTMLDISFEDFSSLFFPCASQASLSSPKTTTRVGHRCVGFSHGYTQTISMLLFDLAELMQGRCWNL